MRMPLWPHGRSVRGYSVPGVPHAQSDGCRGGVSEREPRDHVRRGQAHELRVLQVSATRARLLADRQACILLLASCCSPWHCRSNACADVGGISRMAKQQNCSFLLPLHDDARAHGAQSTIFLSFFLRKCAAIAGSGDAQVHVALQLQPL